jgi:hypothetical protein
MLRSILVERDVARRTLHDQIHTQQYVSSKEDEVEVDGVPRRRR